MRFDLSDLVRGMVAALPAVALGLFGMTALAWMMLAPPAPAAGAAPPGQIGVVFAPWSAGGMAQAATLDLPIVALRWGGHLAIVDISSSPDALRELQARGHVLIATSAPPSCFSRGKSGV